MYLKRNQDAYCACLTRVRTEGAWEEWREFFVKGVVEVAEPATETTMRIVQMIERDRQKLHQIGRGSTPALRVHEFVVRYVVMSLPRTASYLNLSEPTAYSAVARLEETGVLREITGRQRGRLYAYDEYLQVLNEGTTDPVR